MPCSGSLPWASAESTASSGLAVATSGSVMVGISAGPSTNTRSSFPGPRRIGLRAQAATSGSGATTRTKVSQRRRERPRIR